MSIDTSLLPNLDKVWMLMVPSLTLRQLDMLVEERYIRLILRESVGRCNMLTRTLPYRRVWVARPDIRRGMKGRRRRLVMTIKDIGEISGKQEETVDA